MPSFCSACSRTHLHVNESFFASVFGTFLKIIRQLGCLTQSDSVARSSGSLGTRAECDKGIYIGTQPCPPVLLRPRLRRPHVPAGHTCHGVAETWMPTRPLHPALGTASLSGTPAPGTGCAASFRAVSRSLPRTPRGPSLHGCLSCSHGTKGEKSRAHLPPSSSH